MGRDFFRLVELAIASGALIIPGLARGDDTTAAAREPRTAAATHPAFVVQSARLDRDGLTLQFSRPLRATGNVDPSKFRLTFAYYSKSRPGDYSYYHEYYGAHRSMTSYEDVGSKVLSPRVEQIGPGAVRIRANRSLDLSSICHEIAASASAEHAGLYLHYAQGGARQIESADGAALSSIAPYWLTKGDATVRSGSFEGRPIPVGVSCR